MGIFFAETVYTYLLFVDYPGLRKRLAPRRDGLSKP